jgi:hypothetical protein
MSAGHPAVKPVHLSARSQIPPAGRHVSVADLKLQDASQHRPPSHCSPASTTESPQTASAREGENTPAKSRRNITRPAEQFHLRERAALFILLGWSIRYLG